MKCSAWRNRWVKISHIAYSASDFLCSFLLHFFFSALLFIFEVLLNVEKENQHFLLVRKYKCLHLYYLLETPRADWRAWWSIFFPISQMRKLMFTGSSYKLIWIQSSSAEALRVLCVPLCTSIPNFCSYPSW